MRMLMNNLDPDVAEDPANLVVYGGSGRAARSWDAYHAIIKALRILDDDETLLVQSGKPVGVCGEAAADPQLACVLVGLGVTSLSCAATAVRAVGAELAAATSQQCQEAARAAPTSSVPASACSRSIRRHSQSSQYVYDERERDCVPPGAGPEHAVHPDHAVYAV